MGKLLHLRKSGIDSQRDTRKRNLARHYIYEATHLLQELSENDQRVSWLLEDCADLLAFEQQLAGNGDSTEKTLAPEAGNELVQSSPSVSSSQARIGECALNRSQSVE